MDRSVDLAKELARRVDSALAAVFGLLVVVAYSLVLDGQIPPTAATGWVWLVGAAGMLVIGLLGVGAPDRFGTTTRSRWRSGAFAAGILSSLLGIALALP